LLCGDCEGYGPWLWGLGIGLILGDGRRERVEMRRKRSGVIYEEVMKVLGAENVEGIGEVRGEAEGLVKRHLEWV
jgi:hypothetical protein